MDQEEKGKAFALLSHCDHSGELYFTATVPTNTKTRVSAQKQTRPVSFIQVLDNVYSKPKQQTTKKVKSWIA